MHTYRITRAVAFKLHSCIVVVSITDGLSLKVHPADYSQKLELFGKVAKGVLIAVLSSTSRGKHLSGVYYETRMTV